MSVARNIYAGAHVVLVWWFSSMKSKCHLISCCSVINHHKFNMSTSSQESVHIESFMRPEARITGVEDWVANESKITGSTSIKTTNSDSRRFTWAKSFNLRNKNWNMHHDSCNFMQFPHTNNLLFIRPFRKNSRTSHQPLVFSLKLRHLCEFGKV